MAFPLKSVTLLIWHGQSGTSRSSLFFSCLTLSLSGLFPWVPHMSWFWFSPQAETQVSWWLDGCCDNRWAGIQLHQLLHYNIRCHKNLPPPQRKYWQRHKNRFWALNLNYIMILSLEWIGEWMFAMKMYCSSQTRRANIKSFIMRMQFKQKNFQLCYLAWAKFHQGCSASWGIC